jgi:hypothetical protein
MTDDQGSPHSASQVPQRSVQFGPVDVSNALIEAQTESGLGATSASTFKFNFGESAEIPDYFGELSVAMIYQGKSRPIFTGSVTEATPVADSVTVKAVGAQQLREHIVSDMVYVDVTTPELIYVLARSSGIRDARLNIDGMESLQEETFEIVVPVDGVVTDRIVEFAGIEFLPADYAVDPSLEISAEQRAKFAAPAYARASIGTSMMLEAEEKGLAAIDVALAWLTVQLRCGAAMLPPWQSLPFSRQEALASPSRRDLVTVRGLTTGRHWFRRPSLTSQERSAHLTSSARPLDGALRPLTLQEKQALLALGRASREPDLLARVQDLWEAIEFYCSGVSVDPLFTSEQLNGIRKSLPKLGADQHKRAEELIGQLNSPPLMIRFKQAIRTDGAPLSEGEINLLVRLRKTRNKVVHGQESRLPDPEDVEYATSVVARLLIYRIASTSKKDM